MSPVHLILWSAVVLAEPAPTIDVERPVRPGGPAWCESEPKFLAALTTELKRADLSADDVRPIFSVSSGAVSLGAYQAGRLHHWMNRRRAAYRVLKTRLDQCTGEWDWKPDLVATTAPASLGIRVAVGASAGAINSLLIALEACRDDDYVPPEKSLLYLTWIAVGFRHDSTILGTPGLLEATAGAGRDPSAGLFNKQPLDAVSGHLREYLDPAYAPTSGWPTLTFRKDCSIGLGHTLLRTRARIVEATHVDGTEGRKVGKTLTDRLLLRVGNRFGAAAPGHLILEQDPLRDERVEHQTMQLQQELTAMLTTPANLAPQGVASTTQALQEAIDKNQKEQKEKVREARIHLRQSGRYVRINDALGTLLKSYQAASAFPVAFPPVALEADPNDRMYVCSGLPGPKAELACLYVDGGALNNNPLDIAIDRFDLQRLPGRTPFRVSREELKSQHLTGPGDGSLAPVFLLLDQNLTPFPPIPPRKEHTGTTFLAQMYPLVGDGPGVITSQQMVGAVQEALSRNLDVKVLGRDSATAGEYLAAMSAFPHEQLRVADFLQGVLDTERENVPPDRPWQHSDRHFIDEAQSAVKTGPHLPGDFSPEAKRQLGAERWSLELGAVPHLLAALGEQTTQRSQTRDAGEDDLHDFKELARGHLSDAAFEEVFGAPPGAQQRLEQYVRAQASLWDIPATIFAVGGATALSEILPASDFDTVRRRTPMLPGFWSGVRVSAVSGPIAGAQLAWLAEGTPSRFGGFGPLQLGVRDYVAARAGFSGLAQASESYSPGMSPRVRLGFDVLALDFFRIDLFPSLQLCLGTVVTSGDFAFSKKVRFGPAPYLTLDLASRLTLTLRVDLLGFGPGAPKGFGDWTALSPAAMLGWRL